MEPWFKMFCNSCRSPKEGKLKDLKIHPDLKNGSTAECPTCGTKNSFYSGTYHIPVY